MTNIETDPFHNGWHDYAISELTFHQRESIRMSSQTWFSSLGYCTLYKNPPAERVYFRVDCGMITNICFYREIYILGILSCTMAVGCPEISNADFMQLIAKRRTQLGYLECFAGIETKVPENGLNYRMTTAPSCIDMIIDLPPTQQEYLSILGPSTRKHLPYYERKLVRDFGKQVRFDALTHTDISIGLLQELTELNSKRMFAKGKSVLVKAFSQSRYELSREIGIAICLYLGTRLVAGTFSYVYKNEAFLILIAHDPEFDKLNLGNLVLWKTIDAIIAANCKRFHLMWGTSLYKQQFRAEPHTINRIIYSGNRALGPIWSRYLTGCSYISRGWGLLNSSPQSVAKKLLRFIEKPHG